MFALCLVSALAGLSMIAASAQAGPDWLIKDPGPPVTDELAQGALPFLVETDVPRGINSTVLGIPTEIKCEKSSVEKGNLEEEGRMSGVQLLDECDTFSKGSLLPECEVVNQPITMPFKGQAFEHGGAIYVLIVLSSAATIEFGPECSLPGSLKLTGYFVIKDCKNDFLTYLVKHLLRYLNRANMSTR